MNFNIICKLLAPHALSRCDTVAATFGIGKVTAISVAKRGLKLDTIGNVNSGIVQIKKATTAFIVECYGSNLKCNSMTDCSQHMWALKTGKNTTAAPKLCSLAPTTEAFVQNVFRCHY